MNLPNFYIPICRPFFTLLANSGNFLDISFILQCDLRVGCDNISDWSILVIEKIGDLKKLEILVQIQSFGNIVGARPTASTWQQRER